MTKVIWQVSQPCNGDPDNFYSFLGLSLEVEVTFVVTLKLCDKRLCSIIKGMVALGPTAMHPCTAPNECKSIYKAYDETWTGAPVEDGESTISATPRATKRYLTKGLKRLGAQTIADKQCKRPIRMFYLPSGLRNLPPTYIAVCGLDPAHDDGTVIKHDLDTSG